MPLVGIDRVRVPAHATAMPLVGSDRVRVPAHATAMPLVGIDRVSVARMAAGESVMREGLAGDVLFGAQLPARCR
jgi:hypothetical protein